MKLVTVQTAFNPADADLARGRLEVAGFHPFITGLSALSTEGYALTTGGILLQVPEDEAVEAKIFLEKAGDPPAA